MIFSQTPLRISFAGGVRAIRFCKDHSVNVERLKIEQREVRSLEGRLRLYFTGKTRSADKTLSEQREKTADRSAELDSIKALAEALRGRLESSGHETLGESLHQNRELKRKLASGISSPDIEQMYASARQGGAIGGKLCGAGGGGFLLLYYPPDAHDSLSDSMQEYHEMPFRFARDGSKLNQAPTRCEFCSR